MSKFFIFLRYDIYWYLNCLFLCIFQRHMFIFRLISGFLTVSPSYVDRKFFTIFSFSNIYFDFARERFGLN